jgi:Major capsid protein GP7
MSLNLLEAAKLVQDPLKRGVIEVFPTVSPVLERLPFFDVTGQAYKYNREQTLPGIAFRGVNQSYTESTGVVNPQVEALYILGGISYVDRALVKTQGNVNNLRAVYDAMKAKAAALEYTLKFFKGDNSTDPNEFDGLENRLTGDQLIDMGSTSGGDTLTLGKIDELLDAVVGGADVLFMNKTLRRKTNTLMRAAGQAIETVSDAFGRQINAYAGVPIGVIETDKDGNEILDFDEDNPGGGTAASSSIYAVRFGVAEYVSGLQATGGIEVEDLGLNRTNYETLVEWITGLGVFHPKAAARLRGIKNA